ncbi:MAG: YjgN family protein [Halopseudomonas sp.]|uniref:YjgN family protein n=1 Tax=Halopseudomonas sp. TaxID=2901191 RepID=UPI003003673F
MPDSFKVVFNGVRVAGIEEPALRGELLRIGFHERQVQALLDGRKVTIKSNLSAEQAERYRQRLQAAGLVTEVIAEEAGEQAAVVEPSARHEPTLAVVPPTVSSGEAPPENTRGSASGRRPSRIKFTGDGGEYFGIWIVNILLLMVTLGFYAPWAKVRNLQYFYGHTLLEDTSFQYLADPWQIFRGRLVAMVAVIIWSVASSFYPLVAMGLLVIFLPVLPWIIMRSLKFHAVNSAYRNIRFDFVGSYWQSVQVVYLWPILAILSLGLLIPLPAQRWYAYLVDNMRFGRSEFSLNLSVGAVYLFFLRMFGVLIGFAVLAALAQLIHSALSIPILILGYLALFGYLLAAFTNLVMSATTLGEHGFVSQLGKRRMLWIFFSNSILVMLTLGFFTPWAKVRMARYRASCTQMLIHGDLDGFVAGEAQRAGAVGLELGDVFDVGISLV